MLYSLRCTISSSVWSAGILTLAYVKLPEAFKIPEQKLDPTFIASVFTGTLATFGVQAAGKKKNGASGGGDANISKKDMEFLIAKASETAPAQTIRIEQAPVTIVPNAAPPKNRNLNYGYGRGDVWIRGKDYRSQTKKTKEKY